MRMSIYIKYSYHSVRWGCQYIPSTVTIPSDEDVNIYQVQRPFRQMRMSIYIKYSDHSVRWGGQYISSTVTIPSDEDVNIYQVQWPFRQMRMSIYIKYSDHSVRWGCQYISSTVTIPSDEDVNIYQVQRPFRQMRMSIYMQSTAFQYESKILFKWRHCICVPTWISGSNTLTWNNVDTLMWLFRVLSFSRSESRDSVYRFRWCHWVRVCVCV